MDKTTRPHYIKWNAQKIVNSDMHVEKLHMKMVEVFLKKYIVAKFGQA